MFLHLIEDEKFTDGAMEIFERVDSGNHDYYLIRTGGSKDLSYTKSSKLKCIQGGSDEYYKLMSSFNRYCAVIIHGFFNPYHIDAVNRSPADVVFLWCFWGGDFWGHPEICTKTFLRKTRMLYYKNKVVPWLRMILNKYTSIKGYVDFFNRVTRQKMPSLLDTDLFKAIKRVNYIAPVIPEDLEELKKKQWCRASKVDWNYPFNLSLENIGTVHISGSNWLVGNSGHYSNNHLDMFGILKKISKQQDKIIVPLSYGDKRYIQDVVWYGQRYFGQQFEPLLDFLPVKDYFSLLSTCSVAFFNTLRQQSMGNIFTALYMGMKVYLREDNPTFDFFKKKGITIFSIQNEIPATAAELDESLQESQKRLNKEIVFALASQDVFEHKTEVLIKVLEKNNRIHG